jgi:rRNA maturation endonuclease Nob1
MIIFSLIPSVMAAQSPLAVEYDISCRGTNDIVVPGGSKITVAFTIKNTGDTAFSLNSLENEILYDHNFFEYLPGSEKATICGAKDMTYSEGHHCVYVNTINKADFAAEQLVVTFDLLVKETNQGESSTIKSVFYNATDGDGNRLAKANIKPVDLKVTIGESISIYELKYIVDDKTDVLNVAKDTTINLRTAPEKVGFTFEGWQINNGEIKPAGAEFTVTSDTTIKAVWEAKNSYKITFDTKGGNSVN